MGRSVKKKKKQLVQKLAGRRCGEGGAGLGGDEGTASLGGKNVTRKSK